MGAPAGPRATITGAACRDRMPARDRRTVEAGRRCAARDARAMTLSLWLRLRDGWPATAVRQQLRATARAESRVPQTRRNWRLSVSGGPDLEAATPAGRPKRRGSPLRPFACATMHKWP